MRKILSILIIFTILFSLSACGGGRGESAEISPELPGDAAATAAVDADPIAAQQSLAGAYTARTVFAADGEDTALLRFVAAGAGQIYLYTESALSGEGRTGFTLLVLDEDGTEQGRFSLEPPEGVVAAMTFDGSALWLATEVWSGQDFSGGQICRFDPALGQITESFDYDGTGMASGVRALFARGSQLYLCTGADVRVWSYEGAELYRAVPDQIGNPSWAMTANGCLAAAGDFQDQGSRVQLLDTEGQSFATPIQCPAPLLLDGGGDYDLCCRDRDRLYGLDLDTGAASSLLTWTDVGVLSVNGGAPLDGGRLLVIDEASGSLLLLEPWQGEGDGPRTVTVATLDPSILEYALVEFNSSQSRYKAVLRDYSQYENGLEQLGLDIAAGDGPDVFDLRGLPVEQYVRRGYLEDLYPYLDAGPDLSREDLDQTLLRAMETDGALYELIPVSTLASLTMDQADLERVGGLTWAGLMAAGGSGCPICETGAGREEFLACAVCGSDSPFIDWDSASCDFDNEDFRAVLTMAAGLMTDAELNENGYDPEAEAQAVWAGEKYMVLAPEAVSGQFLFMLTGPLWAEGMDPALPGLPGRSGARYLLTPNGLDLAMAAAGQEKEGAWAFLRSTLDCEEIGTLMGFTLLGEDNLPPDGANSELGYTEADAAAYSAAVREAVGMANGVLHRDGSILAIILDEAAAYFAGDVSVTPEAVASAIQSRASLYMAEQS